MASELTQWLTQELKILNWTHATLATKAGVSRSLVTRVLSGSTLPSIEFCVKIAIAFDIPPAQVLHLAGILPNEPAPASPGPVTAAIMRLVEQLPPEDRQQVLEYVQFVLQRRKG